MYLFFILKNRDIALPKKVFLVKAMVFPVVMYGCESWTIEKAEHRGIDAFELWTPALQVDSLPTELSGKPPIWLMRTVKTRSEDSSFGLDRMIHV